jgi:hypothetical protein
MKRRILTGVAVVTLSLATAGSVRADAGAPGSTFPEQPGTHLQNACAVVGTNPGTGAGGVIFDHASPNALAILNGLYTDNCLGG